MPTKKQQQEVERIEKDIAKGFFGFWVRKYRVSFLMIIFILMIGFASLALIPKESTPDIEFGILSITTVYTGVSPEDIDSLITTEIERELENIEGIDKIESTSRLGVSSMILTLETEANTSEVLVDVNDAVDKADVPNDAEDPVVTEISSDNELVYSTYLHARGDLVSKDELYAQAKKIQDALEGKNGITTIDITGGDEYDLEVLISKDRAQALGVTLADVADAIRSYNQNQPLGNFQVGDTLYDFRIDGELEDFTEIFQIPLALPNETTVLLGEVIEIRREWDNEAIQKLGKFEDAGYNYVKMIFNKKKGSSIFATATDTRAAVSEFLETPEFRNIEIVYGDDLADLIKDDYRELARNGLTTLVLVFVSLLFFIGIKEALIATFAIPLAFLITFFVLNQIGLSLNFMTNFSLILTFGIAIDTTIVIIEGAAERLKVGYKPRNAVLLAVRDFKMPLIAGTTTTLVVFLPMMSLPDVVGKFLAYIPITVFSTLVAALFLALTVNTALFYKLSRTPKNYFRRHEGENLLEDDNILLAADREGREPIGNEQMNFRQRSLHKLENWYEGVLGRFIASRKSRRLSIWVPIILLLVTFFTISPGIGFKLFPSGDNPFLFVTVESSPGDISENLVEKALPKLDEVLSKIPEQRFYSIEFDDHVASVVLELEKKAIRDKKGQRLSDAVEEEMFAGLESLKSDGLIVETRVETGGPPVGKAVGLKLTAENTSQLDSLISVSKEFERKLREIEGSKNISNSSEDSPGQLVFEVREDVVQDFGVTPTQVYGHISQQINGAFGGTIKRDDADIDIVVKFDLFADTISPSEILATFVQTPKGPVALSALVDYEIKNAVTSIKREDGDLLIAVEADLEKGYYPGAIQGQFVAFAESYDFPKGIDYKQAGENAENVDLLIATAVSFFVSILLIFVILVLLFNSYSQPLIILYSVVLAMLGVNLGLWFMNRLYDLGLFYGAVPYSMPFGIGFIALTGIVVNDAIILIDRINHNVKLGMEPHAVVKEAGRSRLQPIILTTITTVFGVLPLASQDVFWAGLSFTIIFGLFAGSTMTLFVIPALYYELFLSEKKDGIIKKIIKLPFRIVRWGFMKLLRTLGF